MKPMLTMPKGARKRLSRLRALLGVTTLGACIVASGCTTGGFRSGADPAPGPVVEKPANFDAALKQNQAALRARNGREDLALYNIGVILAHPSNPRRDQAKASRSFKTLLNQYPHSAYAEQAKTWIQVLEEQQKVAEEKRALNREREVLLQERQRLNYTNEKSQQLDMEIEKRRRQSLGR